MEDKGDIMDRKNTSSRRIKEACIIVMVQMDRCMEYKGGLNG